MNNSLPKIWRSNNKVVAAVNSLSLLGETLRSAYAAWLDDQLSGWLRTEGWQADELDFLVGLDAATAMFQEQGNQFAALETWLTAGFLPPDLADFDLQTIVPPLTASPATSGLMIPSRPDNGLRAVQEFVPPRFEATPPVQRPGSSTVADAGDAATDQEMREKGETARPEASSFKKGKGLRDLAAFLQTRAQEDEPSLFSGSPLAHSTHSNRESGLTGDIRKSAAPHSNDPLRPRSRDVPPSRSSIADEEGGVRGSQNFPGMHQTGSEILGVSEVDQEPGLPELSAANELFRLSQSGQHSPSWNAGTRVASRSSDSPPVRLSVDEPVPAAQVPSVPVSDSEQNHSPALSSDNSAPFDVEDILDALVEEAERDFKRIYGR